MAEVPPRAVGPLHGVKVVELGGIGPVPYACACLADLGADVIRVARPADQRRGAVMRGRPAWSADLKRPDDKARALTLVERADVLVEGFRPGVAERLGLGPDDCSARNPRLVYARMTGWGQSGPRVDEVGHDINYLGITGVLGAIRDETGRPAVPMNLVADYGGGAMFVLLGIVAALYERDRSGRGQVVDAAMVDGVSSLMSLTWSMVSAGQWTDDARANLLDGGAPYYDTYRCADGRYLAVGALEPQFYRALGQVLGLDLPPQDDRSRWPELRSTLAGVFVRRPRADWLEVFAGLDCCVTPVLGLSEAAEDEHLRARGSLVRDEDGRIQPGVAPRLSRTPGAIGAPGRLPAALDPDTLVRWGVDPDRWTRAVDARS